MNVLTAKEIEHISNLENDKAAVRVTLDIALQHSDNRLSELRKGMRKFWEPLLERYQLDTSKVWVLKQVDGTTCVVENTKENKDD